MSRPGRGERGSRRRGYGPNGFEEGGGYMAVKISKLHHQYEASVCGTAGQQTKGIFSGVAIFVNGYTDPTAEELKRVMMMHGGTYHHYYSRSHTTHIIASNLPDTKIKNMNTDRIVDPKWITDSLQAGRLLDYTKYILYTNQSRSQPKLSFKPSFSSSENMSVSSEKKTSTDNLCDQRHSCQEDSGGKTDTEVKAPSVDTESDAVQIAAENTLKHNNSGDENNAASNPCTEKSSSSSTSSNAHQSVKSHSTANPAFLSEFYSNSRLHHISTMGAVFKQYVNDLHARNEPLTGRDGLLEWLRGKRGETDIDTENFMRDIESEQSKSDHIKKGKKRTIMHIDMDCFFVSVGLRRHPELRGRPVAVTHARNTSQGQVREGMDRQYELNYYKERAEKRLQGKMRPMKTSLNMGLDAELGNEEEQDGEAAENDPPPISSDKKFSSISLIDDSSSMSEIASCNYEARKYGVKNGMFMGPALKLCPSLQTIPYDFEGYKEVSYKLYDIVASFTRDIEAVSCDEMFVDLTELLDACQVAPLEFASYLREKVQAATGCPCSAGLGPNMLVARMATRLAKPSGQHLADPDDLTEYMKQHKVTGLPGVGWSLGKRLEAEGIITCGDLQKKSLGQLQTAFGSRTGQSLFNYCRGTDDRPVKSEHVRKSVSAEVNYGIRFTCQADAEKFVAELATEVETRLNSVLMKGRCITLKLKIRAKDAPVETAKFMGHGVCDNVAKSVTLPSAISSAAVIEMETLSLLHQVKAPPQDFRGVGIQVSRLEGQNGQAGGSRCGTKSIKSFLLSAHSNAKKSANSSDLNNTATPPVSSSSAPSDLETESESISCQYKHIETPPTHQTAAGKNSILAPVKNKTIDAEVLLALPEELREQVIAEYKQQGYIIPSLDPAPQPSTSGYKNSVQKKMGQALNTGTFDTDQLDGFDDSTPDSLSSLTDRKSIENSRCKEEVCHQTPDGGEAVGQPHSPDMFEEEDEGEAAAEAWAPVHQADSPDMFEEDDQDAALITSYSQVDTSFLNAIPEDLREELRQDFERQKQAAASTAAAAAASHTLQQSPHKQERPVKIEVRRGRWGRTDPRRAQAEGLITITSIMSARRPRHGFTSPRKKGTSPKKASPRKKIASPKKRSSPKKGTKGGAKNWGWKGKSKEAPMPAWASPTKQKKETQEEEGSQGEEGGALGQSGTPHPSQQEQQEPSLCGEVEVPEVKSLIREWVWSCSSPEEEDADILSQYYTSLVTHHDLEKLDLLIKYLYRQVAKTQNEQWKETYQLVITRVQSSVLQHHHGRLKIVGKTDIRQIRRIRH